MFKVSIIPDTNVLISNLELVKYIYSCDISVPYTVNFSKTVLNELDNLKKKNVGARNAIRFIEGVSGSLKTEIEGKVDDRKLDVVVESRNPVHESNSDDRILNYCFQLENPVFLTNDKAFYLKCVSFNVATIVVDSKRPREVLSEIEKAIGLDSVDRLREAGAACIEKLKNAVKTAVEPVILGILSRELGTGHELMLEESNTLEHLLGLVQNNFFLFRDFLPRRSPKIIAEFQECLGSENLKKSKELARLVCSLFRKILADDSL